MATPLTRAWRRIALLSGDHRYDLAIPLDDSLSDVVRRLGLSVVPGRHAIVDRAGRETPLASRGEDLDDGALLTVIDLTAAPLTAAERRRVARESVRERGTVWWMLGVAGRPTQVEDMIMPPQAHGVKVISIGMFTSGNAAVVWRGPMLHRALQQFLADVYLVPQMFNARRLKTDLTPFPTLVGISTHLESLPAFAAARPEVQPDAH